MERGGLIAIIVGGILPHIPPELFSAITAQGGGRLAIVIGAGCSCEPPTQMPLARELSLEAHRKLVHEGVLNTGECADPTDLASLATLIFRKTGSQAALIRQFPVDKMRTARANEGYRMLIALMLEGAWVLLAGNGCSSARRRRRSSSG
jgi:hypothetical protein